MIKPTLYQKFRIWVFGHVETKETIRKEGWKSSLPVYIVFCQTHGYVRTRVTGGRRLECPVCNYRSV